MNIKFISIALLSLSCVANTPLHFGSSAESFVDADTAFRERATPQRARAALKQYRQIYRAKASSPLLDEAAWRLAMACQFVGMRVSGDPDERVDLFREGRDAGLRGAELNSECAPCHFWAGINMALLGQEVGIFKMIFTLPSVIERLETSIRIEPGYAYGGAHRVLGLIYRKLPGILGGSDEKAKTHFELAIQVAKDEPLNYLNLADLLTAEFSQPKEAKELLEQASARPYPPLDRIESREAYDEIRVRLQSLAQS